MSVCRTSTSHLRLSEEKNLDSSAGVNIAGKDNEKNIPQNLEAKIQNQTLTG